jgi:hypothetical protein
LMEGHPRSPFAISIKSVTTPFLTNFTMTSWSC